MTYFEINLACIPGSNKVYIMIFCKSKPIFYKSLSHDITVGHANKKQKYLEDTV